MAKRILVADDSGTIQKALAMVFGGQDVTLVAARSLDEAMGAARKGRPDIVIADATLGNSTGYDLCATMQQDPVLRSVPVYILASQHVPYDEGRAQRVGATGHFIKPFDSTQLLEQMTVALERAERATPAAPQASMPARTTDPQVDLPDEPDEYGEFTIERSTGSGPAPAGLRVAPAPAPAPAPPPRPAPAAPAPAQSLRPSLIPGVKPGAGPPRRPAAPPPAPAPTVARAQPPVATRTIMGLPAVIPPMMPGQQARPVTPPPAPTPPPRVQPPPPAPVPVAAPAPVAAPVVPPAAVAAVSSAVAQKVAAIAQRGPEYEALAKLSREV